MIQKSTSLKFEPSWNCFAILIPLVIGVSFEQANVTVDALFLYEKSFNLKTISQGDCGHFRENNLIILSKVATIALRDCFQIKTLSI